MNTTSYNYSRTILTVQRTKQNEKYLSVCSYTIQFSLNLCFSVLYYWNMTIRGILFRKIHLEVILTDHRHWSMFVLMIIDPEIHRFAPFHDSWDRCSSVKYEINLPSINNLNQSILNRQSCDLLSFWQLICSPLNSHAWKIFQNSWKENKYW